MDDFFISVAAREDGPTTCTNPQHVLVTLRVCRRSQLRTSYMQSGKLRGFPEALFLQLENKRPP